ncbi:MAG: cytochrome C oxidase Cbb3, partial [Chitinophagaceae bacterium]
IMPPYAFMLTQELDTSNTAAKINAMRTLGVPYEKGFEKIANQHLLEQATGIANNLKADSILISPTKEVIALIAYVQRMGKDISKQKNN